MLRNRKKKFYTRNGKFLYNRFSLDNKCDIGKKGKYLIFSSKCINNNGIMKSYSSSNKASSPEPQKETHLKIVRCRSIKLAVKTLRIVF